MKKVKSKIEQKQPSKPACFLGSLRKTKGLTLAGPFVVRLNECDNGTEICKVPVDGSGRFIIKLAEKTALTGKAVEFTVIHIPSDKIMGKQISAFPRHGMVKRVSISLDHSRPKSAQKHPPVTKKPAASGTPWEIVSLKWRLAIAKMLKGVVPEKDKRPLVPLWVNRTINELDTAGWIAANIIQGELKNSKRLLALISADGPESRFFSREPTMNQPGFTETRIGRYPGFPGGIPCTFNTGPTIEVAVASLYLDIYRAERLGDLTQPGSYTTLAAQFLKERFKALNSFADTVADFHNGRINHQIFETQIYLDKEITGADPLILPDNWQKLDHETAPIMSQSPRYIQPGRPGIPPAGDLLCDIWFDCVDEIVTVATNYKPPLKCPDESIIGSITPSVVCKGKTDVEIEIRPKDGNKFSSSGGVCNLFLQRDIRKKTLLKVTSFTEDVVKVLLTEAKLSGCIGFLGSGQGNFGNIGFIKTCLSLGRINSPIIDLVTGGTTDSIQCTGNNKLTVVPSPVLDSLGATGQGGYSSSENSSAYLLEESCTEVMLHWRFDFGTQDFWVDPSEFIKVKITRVDGSVVAEALNNEGTLAVTEREDQVYILLAAVIVDGNECGRSEGTITVERYQALHLQGPEMLQIGQSANLQIQSSCPALGGGLIITVLANQPNRLQISNPDNIIIPEGQNQTTVQISALGTGCTEVAITASAEGHNSASIAVDVFDTPKITAITPTIVQACRTFEIQITGNCFKQGETSVWAIKSGEMRTLQTLAITPESIHCRGIDFPPGAWDISVTSRGLESNADTLNVEAVSPVINTFQAILANQNFEPCSNNWVIINWNVTDAERIVIKENGTSIDERLYECGEPSVDEFTRIIQRQTTYRLEAYPVGGGNPVVATRTVGERTLKNLQLLNSSGRTLVIWKIEGWYSNSSDIPQNQNNKTILQQGDTTTLSFNDCQRYHIVAIDKEMAENSGYNSEKDAIVIGHLRRWEMTLVSDENGEETGETIY